MFTGHWLSAYYIRSICVKAGELKYQFNGLMDDEHSESYPIYHTDSCWEREAKKEGMGKVMGRLKVKMIKVAGRIEELGLEAKLEMPYGME